MRRSSSLWHSVRASGPASTRAATKTWSSPDEEAAPGWSGLIGNVLPAAFRGSVSDGTGNWRARVPVAFAMPVSGPRGVRCSRSALGWRQGFGTPCKRPGKARDGFAVLEWLQGEVCHAARRKVQSNFSPRTPKHQGKRRSTRDQRARRINKIEVPAMSAKPPSPVQIRAAPPVFHGNSRFPPCARRSRARILFPSCSQVTVPGHGLARKTPEHVGALAPCSRVGG